ncbi:MAG TPA: thioredoxin fold domain-containing protein [Luteimonas sp.]|nr:thioredoxin fold domain-containing protein [Luteimonas sp.]
MKTILALLLATASLSACAQEPSPAAAAAAAKPAAAAKAAAGPTIAPGTAAARARDAVRSIDPNIAIEQVSPAPIPGFQAVIVGGQVLYVSNDGKYLIQGSLYDVGARRDLGQDAMKRLRVELLRSVPVADRIVFAPKDPKYTVTVFTDVECGYCRKFHSQIAEYNKLGIAVEYLAFPRMGLGSEDFRKMVAVWCAPDRRKALTDAKNDRNVAAGNCTNPVTMEYQLGRRAGLTGTPMVLAADGTQLGGYLAPEQLRAALDALAAGGKPTASGAVGLQ